MSARLPYFDAIQDGYLYRVFVADSELICVGLGSGFVVHRPSVASIYFGMIVGTLIGFLPCICYILFRVVAVIADLGSRDRGEGGISASVLIFLFVCMVLGMGIGKIMEASQKSNLSDDAANFEKGVQEDLAHLIKLDAAGIRGYVREKKRGYVVPCKQVENAKIAYVGKWRRIYLGQPDPALIIDHPSKGKMTLVFRKRSDTVIALYELEQLLGEKLEIALDVDDYQKALKKYRKTREA